MDEAVIATFDDVKFIEGVTFLTQQNWQEYFSPVIKNGVVDGGLEPRNYVGSTTYTNGRVFVTDGFVFANGICAKIETPTGYTDFGTVPSGKKDRLICVRVYFGENTAQLIQKTDVMEIPEGTSIDSDTYNYFSVYTMDILTHDESYMMERNSSYWDIPIFYQGNSDLSWSSKGLDLRRIINKTRQINPEDTVFKGTTSYKIKISGNNIYRFTAPENVFYTLCLDPVDLPDGAIIYTNKQISKILCATNNLLSTPSSSLSEFMTPGIDVNDYHATDIGHTISYGGICLRITYVGNKGSYIINNRLAYYPFEFMVEQIIPEQLAR